jgi:GH18 family chitinase
MSDILPAQTKRLVGFFPAWGIHAQNYHIADIPAGQLSHVVYAFADVTAAGDCVSINAQDNRLRAVKRPEQSAGADAASPAPLRAMTETARLGGHFGTRWPDHRAR